MWSYTRIINRQWLDDKMKRNNGKHYLIGYFLKVIKTKHMHIFTIPVSAWNRMMSLTSRHTINWSVSKVPSWHTFVAPIWSVNKIVLCRRIRKQDATRIVLSIFFLNPKFQALVCFCGCTACVVFVLAGSQNCLFSHPKVQTFNVWLFQQLKMQF